MTDNSRRRTINIGGLLFDITVDREDIVPRSNYEDAHINIYVTDTETKHDTEINFTLQDVKK